MRLMRIPAPTKKADLPVLGSVRQPVGSGVVCADLFHVSPATAPGASSEIIVDLHRRDRQRAYSLILLSSVL